MCILYVIDISYITYYFESKKGTFQMWGLRRLQWRWNKLNENKYLIKISDKYPCSHTPNNAHISFWSLSCIKQLQKSTSVEEQHSTVYTGGMDGTKHRLLQFALFWL